MSQPTFVFLHGWLMSPAIWKSAERVVPESCALLNLWQPAHGDEPALAQHTGIEGWASLIVERVDKAGADQLILVGHSMGALVALQIALDHPDRVAGLVLAGATSRAWSDEALTGWRTMADAAMQAWSIETASALAPWLMGPAQATDRQFLERWTREVESYRLQEMAGLVDAIADRQPTDGLLGSIRSPTLIVHGAADASIPLEEAEFIAARIPAATLAVIQGAGHCPPLESPASFADEFAGFVAKQGWSR